MFRILLLKEIKLIFRDRYALLILFLMPIVFVIIMSFSLQEVFDKESDLEKKTSFKIFNIINNKNTDDWSSQFSTLPGFDIVPLENNKENIQNAKKLVLESKRLALVFPIKSDSKSATSTIEIYYAPTTPGYIRALLETNILLKFYSIGQSNTVATGEKILHISNLSKNQTNIRPSSVQQSVPAWLIFAMFFIVIPFSATLLIELDNGTLKRLHTFAIAKHWILLGKLLPYMLVNLIQTLLMFVTGIFLMPALGAEAIILSDNAWLLLLVSIALSLMAISFALLIATLVKTHEQASSIGGAINLLMGALGGVMVPVFVMPQTMQTLAQFSPMNWGLEAFLEILLRQGDLSSVLPYIMQLTGLSLVLFMVAYAQLKRRLLQAK